MVYVLREHFILSERKEKHILFEKKRMEEGNKGNPQGFPTLFLQITY
jgi:hypothetical protein